MKHLIEWFAFLMIIFSSGIWVCSKIKSCAWVTWSVSLIHLYLSRNLEITSAKSKNTSYSQYFNFFFLYKILKKSVYVHHLHLWTPLYTYIPWPLFHSLLLLVIQQLFIWKLNKLKFLLCYYWDILTDSTQSFHPFVLWSIASHFSWRSTVWRCTEISGEAGRHLCHVA